MKNFWFLIGGYLSFATLIAGYLVYLLIEERKL